MSSKHLISTTMGNEGPYLLEWLAFHFALGVDHALVFSQHCRDGTDKMLYRLDKMGLVTHRKLADGARLPRPTDDPVTRGYDWAVHLEAFEFLNLKTDTINGLTTRGLPVTLPRRIFGSAGVSSFHDGFLTETMRRAAPGHSKDSMRVLHRTTVPAEADTPDPRMGQINAYTTRTHEAFFLQAHLAGADVGSFGALDRNDVFDGTILRKLDAMKDVYDDLMGDSRLARLHNRAVEWHRKKIQGLLDTPAGRAQFDAMQPPLDLFPGLRKRLQA